MIKVNVFNGYEIVLEKSEVISEIFHPGIKWTFKYRHYRFIVWAVDEERAKGAAFRYVKSQYR